MLYTLKKNWDFAGNESLRSFHVLCELVSICSSLVLGTLLAWHIYLTSRNMTTIEYHEVKRATRLNEPRKSGLAYHHPYDGFMVLMDGKRIEDLQRMYVLFSRVNALESLGNEAFSNTIKDAFASD